MTAAVDRGPQMLKAAHPDSGTDITLIAPDLPRSTGFTNVESAPETNQPQGQDLATSLCA
jgi:hypothetical protein